MGRGFGRAVGEEEADFKSLDKPGKAWRQCDREDLTTLDTDKINMMERNH